MAARQTRQPRVHCYNPVRVTWTDVECEFLLDQRITRNDEYWRLGSGGRGHFWRGVARKINRCFGTRFAGEQASAKWKNLRNAHVVSIFMLIYYYIYINIFLGSIKI
jgi:hypothetical protein